MINRIQKVAVLSAIGLLTIGLTMGAIRLDFNPESGQLYHPYGMPFYTFFVAIGCTTIGIVAGQTQFFASAKPKSGLGMSSNPSGQKQVQ